MSNGSKLEKEAMQMLKETSRTFYIPITMLGTTLRKTVGSAYLCMRAIDEIEDHETLDAVTKERLLRETSDLLAREFDRDAYLELVQPYEADLPEVTLRLGDWIAVCPPEIVAKVQDSTGVMATGMADWVKKDWDIQMDISVNGNQYHQTPKVWQKCQIILVFL